ncbi:MAG TPA: hypothetical protein VFO67_07850 [Gemmatimonadales bacterium]|nr:hypothetical protein [Gemmatimonadales bacterium]
MSTSTRKDERGMRPACAIRAVVSALFMLLLAADAAVAQARFFVYSVSTRSFTTFDVGGEPCGLPGINDLGQIVGAYTTTTVGFPCHGFVRDGKTITSFDHPGAYITQSTGINNAGQIVGTRCVFDSTRPHGTDCRAFLKDGQTFTSYEYPGALFTYGAKINSFGQIAGTYRTQVVIGNSEQDFDHGLLIDGTAFTAFEFPGTFGRTSAGGINDSSVIVGTYVEEVSSWPGFRYRGFLKQADQFSSLDYPGALFTFADDINNLGQVVGTYTDSQGYSHGFIKDGDTFMPFGVFGAETVASGLNNLGQIVGLYYPLPVFSTINTLIRDLGLLGLPKGTLNSLVAKLKEVITAFDTGDAAAACENLDAFDNQVEALAGKRLSFDLSDSLLSRANEIEAMLGCSL